MKRKSIAAAAFFCAACSLFAQDASPITIPIDPSQISIVPSSPQNSPAEDPALRKLAIAEALKEAQADFKSGQYLKSANIVAQTFSVLQDRDDFESFLKSVDLPMLSKLDMELVLTKDVPPETSTSIKKIMEVELGAALSEAMRLSASDIKGAYEKLRGAFEASVAIGEEKLSAFLGAIDYVVLKEGLGGVEKSEEKAGEILRRTKEISKNAEKMARLAIANIYHYATFSQNAVNEELKALASRNEKAKEILNPLADIESESSDDNVSHAYTLLADIALSPDAEPFVSDFSKISPENQKLALSYYDKAMKASPEAFVLEGTAPIKFVSLLLNGCDGVKNPERAVGILNSTKEELRSQILPRYNRVILFALYSDNPETAAKAKEIKDEYNKLFPKEARTSGFIENDASFAYNLGIGLKQDAEKSWQWAVKGAREGNFYALWDKIYANAPDFEKAKEDFKKLPEDLQNDKALSAVRGLVALSENKIEDAANLVYASIKEPESILPVVNRDLKMIKDLIEKYKSLPNLKRDVLEAIDSVSKAAEKAKTDASSEDSPAESAAEM